MKFSLRPFSVLVACAAVVPLAHADVEYTVRQCSVGSWLVATSDREIPVVFMWRRASPGEYAAF